MLDNCGLQLLAVLSKFLSAGDSALVCLETVFKWSLYILVWLSIHQLVHQRRALAWSFLVDLIVDHEAVLAFGLILLKANGDSSLSPVSELVCLGGECGGN